MKITQVDKIHTPERFFPRRDTGVDEEVTLPVDDVSNPFEPVVDPPKPDEDEPIIPLPIGTWGAS